MSKSKQPSEDFGNAPSFMDMNHYEIVGETFTDEPFVGKRVSAGVVKQNDELSKVLRRAAKDEEIDYSGPHPLVAIETGNVDAIENSSLRLRQSTFDTIVEWYVENHMEGKFLGSEVEVEDDE